MENDNPPRSSMPADQLQRLDVAKTALHALFGQAVLAMSSVPRYRHQSLNDLRHLVMDPLVRDRIAIARQEEHDFKSALTPPAIAVWASVSDEVDEKITEQVRSGVFPVRLKPDEWDSGETVWLLDIIAPTRDLATKVVSTFNSVAKRETIKVHPVIAQLVDRDVLQNLRSSTPVQSV